MFSTQQSATFLYQTEVIAGGRAGWYLFSVQDSDPEDLGLGPHTDYQKFFQKMSCFFQLTVQTQRESI